MSNKPEAFTIALVMPVFNESGSIEGFLRDIVGASQDRQISIVVVDDSSDDTTPEVLAELKQNRIPLTLIRNKTNLGHGPSTLKALHEGLKLGVDIVVATDGDGQIRSRDLFSMATLAFERNSIIEGYRVGRRDEWFRTLVSLGTRLLVAMRSGAFPRDANTPFRAYPSNLLAEVLKDVSGTSMIPNLLISSAVRQRQLPLCEFEVSPFSREGADSRGVTWKQTIAFIPSWRFLKFVWGALLDWRMSPTRLTVESSKTHSLLRTIIGRASVGRYGFIGMTGVGVDLLVFGALVAAGMQPVGATLVSTSFGILNNYILNSILNFRMSLSRSRGFRYVLVGICGLSASALLIYLLSTAGLSPVMAKLVSIPLVVFGQFLANKHWTFAEAKAH